jgi:hypothetical protein
MAYPLPTAAISVSGEALPTYLTGSLAGSYSSGQTLTLNSIPTWLEVGTNGQITANPLGTTGLFVVAVDFGLSTEEHILCSSLVTGTGVVTVWTDGVLNGRGWDGTTISAHSAGSSSNNNCFPMLGGTYFAGLSSVVSTLSTTYAPKAGSLTPTLKTVSATAVAGDFVVMNGSGNTTVTLPAAPANGTQVGVVNIGTGTTTLAPSGSDTIRGSTTSGAAASSSQYQTLVVIYNSASTSWEPVVADANKPYLSRTNSFVGANTFSNTVTLSGITTASGTATANSTMTIQQQGATATITGVATGSPSAGSVTFTANNSFGVGQLVNITGVVSAPTGVFNVSTVSITAVSSTGFSIASTATASYTSGGTASAYTTGTYGLVVKDASGTTVLQTGNKQSGTTTLAEGLSTSSWITVRGAAFSGSLSVNGYINGSPTITAELNNVATLLGDSYAVTPFSNTSYRLFRVDGWGRLGALGDNRPVTVVPVGPAILLTASGSGTTITCTTSNHNFSTGQWVTLSNLLTATALNGTWQVATTAGATAFTLTSTATGTATFATSSFAVSAVSASTPTTGYVTYTTGTAHGLWVGATVTVSGITTTTAYNSTNAVVVAVPSTTTFAIYNATTGGSPIFTTATASYNTALAIPVNSASAITNPSDTFQVQDIYQNPRFGVSNTSTSVGSPVWAVNAYSGKVINVANGSATGDAVNYGQLSTFTGATSIATVGTITAGVWNATPITNTYLANSAVTVGSTSISLGSTATAISGLTLTSPTATNQIVSTTASGSIPFIVRGAVSQTADLLEWQSSASAILAKINSGGNFFAPSYNATGLTGATTATRYVGGTTNGAPVSGTFQVGDFIIDQTATIWVCTVGGTPGTWWSTISNHMVIRSANATAFVNEVTIFTGATGQTISAPSSPQDGASWSFINRSANVVTLGFAGNSMIPLGGGTSVTSYTVNPNEAYSFINYAGGQWYMLTANGADHIVGVVATVNGGTGLSGFTAGTNALYTTSTTATSVSSGTLPIAAGGTSATSASGALTALGASPLAGSSSISTVGTVTAGTWNATAISNTYIANPQVTVGSTNISLGATATAVSGLTLTSPILNNPLLNSPLENVTIVGTGLTAGATGTATLGTSSVILYTASASGAFTLNVSTTASPLTTGQSATVAFMVLNGATAYAPTAITINGSAPATLRWQGTGATYPSTADASCYDAYTITVIQTAASAYTVFASQTKF